MFSHTTACKGQTTFPAGLGALLTPSVPGIGFRCVAEAAPPVRCPFQLCGEVEQLEFGSEHDLTAEGSVAWAHWGLDSSFAVNHNIGSGRSAKITAVMIGEGQPVRYDDVSSQATTQPHPSSQSRQSRAVLAEAQHVLCIPSHLTHQLWKWLSGEFSAPSHLSIRSALETSEA